MSNDSISVGITVPAAPETVFALLANPANHATIDGTGMVRAPVEQRPVTEVGQVFWMDMYYPGGSGDSGGSGEQDGQEQGQHYRMANQVVAFDPPEVIAWKPGREGGEAGERGTLQFGGWVWRYDLTRLGPSETEVRHTYDWSETSEELRARIQFPPFSRDTLQRSLQNLAELATSNR